MTTNDVQIIYFSGYIRNWQSLCGTLGIALPLSREEREAAILKNAYAKWGTDMAQQLCGMFAVVLYDENEKQYYSCSMRLRPESCSARATSTPSRRTRAWKSA